MTTSSAGARRRGIDARSRGDLSSTPRFGSSVAARLHADDAPGATKRAIVSTCPSVWSFSRPSLEPEHPLDAEGVARGPPRSVRCDSPGLRFGLSRHCRVVRQRALAVHLDRAALEHPREAEGRASARRRRSRAETAVVVQEHVLAAPAVEARSRPRPRAAPRRHEDRRRVAQPDVAERDPVEADGKARSASFAAASLSASGTRTSRRSPRGSPRGVQVRDGAGERR